MRYGIKEVLNTLSNIELLTRGELFSILWSNEVKKKPFKDVMVDLINAAEEWRSL